jgi:hypothetical protein
VISATISSPSVSLVRLPATHRPARITHTASLSRSTWEKLWLMKAT